MGQVSSKLRRYQNGYTHWCPGCNEMHVLPDSWNFVNGDLVKPTFTPSFDHGGVQYTCHYILTDGVLNFCGDCTHPLSGKSVELPDLPNGYRD